VLRLFSRRNNPNENPFEMKYSYGSINMYMGPTEHSLRANYGIQSFGVEKFSSGSMVARLEVRTYGPVGNPNML
jgi:hypothetical protein